MENRLFQLEYQFQQPDGTVSWVFGQAVADSDLTGQIIGYVGTITDISARKQAEEKLIYNALHDPLTNLPNRNLLMERLVLAIHRTKRIENYHFAVLFLDLDRFKIITYSAILLIGYGNDLRSDDAVEQRVSDLIASWKLANLCTLGVRQLTPELAELLAKFDVVIFVDAYPATVEQNVQVCPIELTHTNVTMGTAAILVTY